MKKMLDDYVYKNLERYGNTLISESDYERLGEEKILNNLKKHGYDCEITIYVHADKDCCHIVEMKDRDIVIQVK